MYHACHRRAKRPVAAWFASTGGRVAQDHEGMRVEKVIQQLRANAVPLALVLSFAMLSAQVSYRIRSDHLMVMFNADMAVLQGKAIIPEFQNRVLGPLMLTAMRDLLPASLADKSVWHLMRLLQAMVAYSVFYTILLQLCGSRARAVVIVGLLAYAYLWTPMTSIDELTSDFFDIMFVASFAYLALRERPLALAAVVIVASANRESGLFAAIIWGSVAGMRHGWRLANWRKFLPAVALLVLGSIVVYAIRTGLAPDMKMRQFIGGLYTLALWRKALTMDGGMPMLAATILAFGLFLRALPRPWSNDQKALALASALCAAITLVFGIWYELRILLPSWTLLAMVCALPARDQAAGNWLANLLGSRAPADRRS